MWLASNANVCFGADCLTLGTNPNTFGFSFRRPIGSASTLFRRISARVKFGYYILNTYVPELDGGSRDIYAKWLEQIDAAESLGFDSLWVTEHHFRHFGGRCRVHR